MRHFVKWEDEVDSEAVKNFYTASDSQGTRTLLQTKKPRKAGSVVTSLEDKYEPPQPSLLFKAKLV